MSTEQAIIEAHQRVTAANAARSERDDLIRQGLAEGISAYRISKITGLAQSAISKIKGAEMTLNQQTSAPDGGPRYGFSDAERRDIDLSRELDDPANLVAMTYFGGDDKPGIDVCFDGALDWNAANHDGEWTLDAADAHLATLGLRRVSRWVPVDAPEVGGAVACRVERTIQN